MKDDTDLAVQQSIVVEQNFTTSQATLALAHSDILTWPTGNGSSEHSSGAGSFSKPGHRHAEMNKIKLWRLLRATRRARLTVTAFLTHGDLAGFSEMI